MLDKKQLRNALKRQRIQLPQQLYCTLSINIEHRLIASSFFQKSQTIACYLPINQEVDTRLIIEKIWELKKQCYLPVIQPNNTLEFRRYRSETPLINNTFNIPEPSESEIKLPSELDLVLLPIVGFDEQCYRLGMGKGYYDRTFNFLHLKTRPSCPILVGLAFEFQKLPQCPIESYDIKLDYVVTESFSY